MDNASRPAGDLKQRISDVETLLGMVESRGLTADQFHSGCPLLFGAQGSEHSLSALIAAVTEGQTYGRAHRCGDHAGGVRVDR